MDKKTHWETVYHTKSPDQVSWTQEIPKTSLKLIETCKLEKTAKIIDIGGGDSKLVDFLIHAGYENISVLDISAKALEKAQKRLGSQADKITWIVCDVLEFEPSTKYDLWHDRAAFHFLTAPEQIAKYIETASRHVQNYAILGTFSESGPKKCSGLPIEQYSEEKISAAFRPGFEKIRCQTEVHETPLGTKQHFLFCSFKKRALV